MDEQKDAIGIVGRFEWFQYGPEGEVKAHGVGENLVTTVGDNFIAARQYGTPTVMGNMKLGSAATAVTKTGAGSYVGTGDYVGGSAHAEDASSPKAGASNNIVHHEHTWAAGEVSGTISRASITDNATNAGEADATHTLAIFLLSPAPNMGSLDTLKVTDDITCLGA